MPDKENSLVIMIDVQDKLTSMLKENCDIACKKASVIASAAKILNIPIIVTEQYPKGLGGTIQEIKNILGELYLPFEKTDFSAVRDDKILKEIKKINRKQVVLFGIEAHVCVFQTAEDLKNMGYEVCVVYDASYSRNNFEKELAIQNLREQGISILSVETVLFMWLKSSKDPAFKEIQSLIK